MNIKHLQIFIHLCDSQNFSKTATAMHMSPSALSRQVQKLEQEIKQTLFVRDNRSVELTPAAKQLLPIAHNIVESWQGYQQQQSSNQGQELTGEIRLYCSVTASYSHLPLLIEQFRQQYPFIEFKISTGDPALAVEKVLNDEVDVAITAKSDELPSRVVFESISEITVSVIAPLTTNNATDQVLRDSPDWSSVPFIVPEAGAFRKRLNDWFKDMKIRPNIYAQVSGNEAIVSMVALGCGIGIVPDVVINNSPVRDKVKKLDVKPIRPFTLGLCCKRSQLDNPLVQALWQIAETKYIHV
ncbi:MULTISPECIES: HTH-type transcriptional activator IlvY [unclassified Vibrio]|uniref:HTH-type transcriptional activator IlvY n=1 Tax=Vibrio sp. HB236076 TaxID=3232307 RepID=A0AB39HAY3_9VIBR|nr:HTH-type transcriptional activator IlvY [Vibrio sp. HB161653]MDP5255148.1 HTH-type transcriptional activator IlvY [Vibrio sp. HB161653]